MQIADQGSEDLTTPMARWAGDLSCRMSLHGGEGASRRIAILHAYELQTQTSAFKSAKSIIIIIH